MPRRSRRKIGGSFKNFISKAGDWLKKTQILSKVGSVLAPMAGAYAPIAGQAVGALSKAGYGRRRMRRGGALRPAGAVRRAMRGGMLNPVGGARRKRTGMMSSKLIPGRLTSRLPMFY